MKTYRNTNWTKRDYECTNIVAARSEKPMDENWAEADESILSGLMRLYIQGGVEYYGYL